LYYKINLMLKIGVLGAGELGKIHLDILNELDDYELVGFHDPDLINSIEATKKTQTPHFSSIDELISKVDVVDIVSSTLSHFDCAQKALRQSKHIFIEKPIANSIEEAKKIMNLSHEANVKTQVGHADRFNPAFLVAQKTINKPIYIESHRLVKYAKKGISTSVVLDLMLYDIDIILSIVKSNIKRINTTGINIINGNPDLVNARIEFDNGCVANLTASRIATKSLNKIRIFQPDASITIDFSENTTTTLQAHEKVNNESHKKVSILNPVVEQTNTIKKELSSFAKAITNDTMPLVTADDGYNALLIAHQILEKLKDSPHLINY
jgi:predicted dehydrogenase